MRARMITVCLLFPFGVAAANAQREAADVSQLPVHRVVLYKSGVGYFEHLGSVTNNTRVAIQFSTGQLNDVLQSLTALDLDGGSVGGVSYNSIAPVSQRLAALRLPLESDVDRLQFYGALRGARVAVHNGTVATAGRVLAVEQKARTKNNILENAIELTLVSDEGTVRTVELTPSTSVHLDERGLRDDVSTYLRIMGSTRGEDVRRMTIDALGSGTRRLFVSYISEVPVWKSTYRLVLPSGDHKPVLQGWAIVDNTVGEDWTNVELSLVAGAPQSFVQQISQPYYVHRPVVPLPSTVMLQPQTHGPTLATGEANPSVGGVSENVSVVARAAAPRGRGGIPGGVVGGVVGGLPTPPPASAGPVTALERISGIPAAATAQDLGDLFEYKLKQPVTIRKNESALVPILNAEIDAERVSLWNRGVGSGRPLRGAWLTNSSALTLDGGSFSVIDADAFAGEGLIESLKPGEKRLVSYGADLAVIVKATQGDSSGRVTKIVARDGMLIASQEEQATWKYSARNEDANPRTLVIEHPLRSGWKVASTPPVVETSPTAARYRLALPAKQEASLTVTERHAGDTTFRLAEFDDGTVTVLVRGAVSEAALRRALQPLTDKRAELAAAEVRLVAVMGQIADIDRDQQRLRENMKALRGSAEERALVERYTRELNAQEDRLATLRDEQQKATAARDAKRRELSDIAAHLTFELGA